MRIYLIFRFIKRLKIYLIFIKFFNRYKNLSLTLNLSIFII